MIPTRQGCFPTEQTRSKDFTLSRVHELEDEMNQEAKKPGKYRVDIRRVQELLEFGVTLLARTLLSFFLVSWLPNLKFLNS